MTEAPDRAYRLRVGERPSEGIRRVARGRAERAAERLREAQRADDPGELIHGARKDLKKLRAVARLLRRELGEDGYRAENARWREAGRLLSPTRDAEVKLEALAALRERFSGLLPAGATAEWLGLLEAERERAVGALREGASTAVPEALESIEEGGERIESWPLETDSWQLFGPGLRRAYRRGRRRMRDAAQQPGGESLHEWRKRVKDLWHQLRILRDACPEVLAECVDRAGELADALGDHHDLTVLREDLRGRELPRVPAPALEAAIAARQAELANTAFDLGERLYARKPKAFLREMRAGWRRRRG
jgi:CHAD domain-containing protein